MIPLFKVNMSANAGSRVSEVLQSGMIGEGPLVEELTENLSYMWDFPNIICTNSCTSSLILALRLAGVKPGDVVLSTYFTFPATNCAIKNLGADISWGNIEKETLCLNCHGVDHQAKIDKANVIVVTLVAGLVPIDFDSFLYRCRKNNIKVIADCAHAYMTEYKGKHISHWVDYCCFSFQAIKHLTTGDGGALTCLNKYDLERAEKLKWFGISRKIEEGKTRLEHQMTSVIEEWGYKSHMNDISAAIGLENLALSVESVEKTRDNSNFYMENLPKEILPVIEKDSIPSYWTFPLLIPDTNRKTEIEICNEFIAQGIIASPMWMNNGKHPGFYSKKDYPWDQEFKKVFIPNGYWLSKEDRIKIVENIKEIIC